MSAHTPGPWQINLSKRMDIKGNIHQVFDKKRFPTAFVPAWDDPEPGEIDGAEEALANARLIAAAPDMLEALLELVRFCDDANDYEHQNARHYKAYQAAVSAISKATGETK